MTQTKPDPVDATEPWRDNSPEATDADRLRHMLLVRKQEFAYLRGVLKREQGQDADHVMGGFPAGNTKGARARDETLKKIAAVEAQLESLWVASHAKRPADAPALASAQVADAAPTAGVPQRPQERPLALPPALPLMVKRGVQWDQYEPADTVAALRWHGVFESAASDETLVAAAVLFAHGKFKEASDQLLEALKAKPERQEQTFALALCLLEVLRAMGDQDRFDWAVLEYVEYWNGVTPQWRSDAAPQHPSTQTTKGAERNGQDYGTDDLLETFWRCPPTWDVKVAKALLQGLENQRSYAIDWADLRHITAEAAAFASPGFAKLCTQPVHLVFFDTLNLLTVLRKSTPQGQSLSDRNAWKLRFSMLQLAREHEEFERAALEYCMTYLETGPSWKPALGSFVGDNASPPNLEVRARQGAAGPVWQLQGEILGSYGLGLPDPREHPTPTRIRIACHELVRMDGSSTSDLLEWISSAQTQTSEIHFDGVSLLVAAFWSALGIDGQVRIHLSGLR